MIHQKKGSPSGRNAYPVTEKREELKKEEKNDMAKKKTFQEYTQEALLEIEKTEASLKQAKLEKEQAEHRIQRSLNYLDTQKKKKRKARTHLLIQKGAAIEAICKDTKYLTEAEFYQLMDELLRHIVLFLLFQLFIFLCYGIGISAGRGPLLRIMDR